MHDGSASGGTVQSRGGHERHRGGGSLSPCISVQVLSCRGARPHSRGATTFALWQAFTFGTWPISVSFVVIEFPPRSLCTCAIGIARRGVCRPWAPPAVPRAVSRRRYTQVRANITPERRAAARHTCGWAQRKGRRAEGIGGDKLAQGRGREQDETRTPHSRVPRPGGIDEDFSFVGGRVRGPKEN
jgi:hypothetical protein